MKKYLLFVLVAFVSFSNGFAAELFKSQSNDVIILAAPSITDTYDDEFYAGVFDEIVDFDVDYANAIYGRDNVFILVDEKTRPYFNGRVPDSILVTTDALHIWMRDFTSINPFNPIQFRYTPASFDKDQETADVIQNEFNQFIRNTLNVKIPQATSGKKYLKLDGGNIVDNYAGRVVVTERFLSDNGLTKAEGVQQLKRFLNANEVAIIPADDPVLAHSDGMVMFGDENTLFVNEYDEPLHTAIINELESVFPDINIIEVETAWDEADPTSACGVNLNATVTTSYIYMPHFGDSVSDKALKTIQENTAKQVIPVPASKVCKLGGSVRCLSWQQSGVHGNRIIQSLGNRVAPD